MCREVTVSHQPLFSAVKPDPPFNLTVQNKSGTQLELTWATPYRFTHCLEHAVKYKSDKDPEWTVLDPSLLNWPTEMVWGWDVISKTPPEKVLHCSPLWLLSQKSPGKMHGSDPPRRRVEEHQTGW